MQGRRVATGITSDGLATLFNFGHPRAMGISVWFFVRKRSGELGPLARRAVDAFIFNGGRLPADTEGFVRYAEVIVSLENRRAVEVLRVGFYQHRALDDGTLDRSHYDEIMRTVPEAAFGWLQLCEPPPGVVAAEHRFAKRRLEHLSQWKPTKVELRQLRDLVNRRAGRELL